MSSWQERLQNKAFIGDLFSTEVEENDQTLLVQSNKGTIYESRLLDLNLSERTSNGSFISDTISDEEVFDAYLKERFTEVKISEMKESVLRAGSFLLKKFSENYKIYLLF